MDPIQRTWTAQSHRSNESSNPQKNLYWLSDNKKIPDLLISIIKNIPKDFCRTKSCLELSSDYSSVIFTINNKIMTKNKSCTLYKTKWSYFQELLTLDTRTPSYWKPMTTLLAQLNVSTMLYNRPAMPISSNSEIHI